jgi:prophage DNA circulation protein
MGWKERLQPGSFRGVPFFATSHSVSGGRRRVQHEFPERDGAQYEDLGRTARKFSLSAYVIGDDYMDRRDALVAALEESGVGRLVHPWKGVLTCGVESYSLGETIDEGRMARIDMEFTEEDAQDSELTIQEVNSAVAVMRSKEAWISNAEAAFPAKFSFGSTPSTTIQRAARTLESTLDKIGSAKQLASTVSDYQRELQQARGKIIELVLDTTKLVKTLSKLVDWGTGSSATPPSSDSARQLLSEVRSLTGIGSTPLAPEIPPSTYNAPDEPSKQIQVAVTVIALGSAAGLVSSVPFETVEEAQQLQSDMMALLDEVMVSDSTSDEIFSAAQDLMTTMVADIQRRILDLSRMAEINLVETTPSIVVAYRVDGSIQREKTLLVLNGSEHPGFISAAKTVRVQTNG